MRLTIAFNGCLVSMIAQVNYSEDAQWNQWIELGVRQLVLSAGNIANSVPEQAHHDVALSRPLTTAPHPSIPVGMEALAKTFESNYIPSMGSWEIPNETFGASADYSIANTTLGASGEDLIPQDTFEATGDDLLQAVDWFDDEVITWIITPCSGATLQYQLTQSFNVVGGSAGRTHRKERNPQWRRQAGDGCKPQGTNGQVVDKPRAAGKRCQE